MFFIIILLLTIMLTPNYSYGDISFNGEYILDNITFSLSNNKKVKTDLTGLGLGVEYIYNEFVSLKGNYQMTDGSLIDPNDNNQYKISVDDISLFAGIGDFNKKEPFTFGFFIKYLHKLINVHSLFKQTIKCVYIVPLSLRFNGNITDEIKSLVNLDLELPVWEETELKDYTGEVFKPSIFTIPSVRVGIGVGYKGLSLNAAWHKEISTFSNQIKIKRVTTETYTLFIKYTF